MFRLVNATSMIDINKRAVMNKGAMRISVPLNIGTFAAGGAPQPSSLHGPFRGRIPSNAEARAG